MTTSSMLMLSYTAGIAMALSLVGAAVRRGHEDMADMLYAVPESGDPFAGERRGRLRPVSAPSRF